MTSKHTPGPWRFWSVHNGRYWVASAAGDGKRSAPLCAFESEEDARLTASGPVMLAALMSIAPYLAARGIDKHDDEAWALFSHALNAIAKATGAPL